MENEKEDPVCYCPTCQAFREGTVERVTTSKRKNYYRFLCSFCLMPSEGFTYKKKKK